MSNIVLGLPKGLAPKPDAAVSPDCYTQMVRVAPNNVQSVQSPATLLGAATTAIARCNVPFSTSEVRFSIPTGMGKHVYVDCLKSRLNFRVKYEATVASATNDTFIASLQSGAHAWWDRMDTLNQNGVAIDSVNMMAIIECHKATFQYDVAERDSMWNYGFRGEAAGSNGANILQGHAISSLSATAGTVPIGFIYVDYSIPLPNSLIGAGARNFCPVGALAKLDLSLWTNAVAPVVFTSNGTATVNPTVQFTIDNMSIDLQYIYLDQKSAALLGAPRETYVHGITNRCATAPYTASAGQQSLLVGLRGRSIRSIATKFIEGNTTTAGSLNGIFDSKAPLATSLSYFLAAKSRFPNVPHNVAQAPSTVFDHALQAADGFVPDKMRFGGVVGSATTYLATAAAITSANGYSSWFAAPGAGSTTSISSLSQFTFGENLQIASTSALNGYDLSVSASNFLEMNLLAQPTYAGQAYFISAQDIIYVIDLETGAIESRV